MNRRCILRLSAMTALAVALLPSNGISQQKSLKDQLVGTWMFISSTTKLPDGSPVWGSNPKGLTIFAENGRYSSHVVRSDRPKFASNSRAKGTPEENKAAVLGGIASFGTYTVDEANKTFTIRFEGSSYPNLEGMEQVRPFMIVGDELKVTNPSPSIGGVRSEITYRRAK